MFLLSCYIPFSDHIATPSLFQSGSLCGKIVISHGLRDCTKQTVKHEQNSCIHISLSYKASNRIEQVWVIRWKKWKCTRYYSIYFSIIGVCILYTLLITIFFKNTSVEQYIKSSQEKMVQRRGCWNNSNNITEKIKWVFFSIQDNLWRWKYDEYDIFSSFFYLCLSLHEL